MTKFVARISLFIAQIGVMFGNYWFTFGLWPKSWTAFFGFASVGVLLLALGLIIEREDA